MEIYCKRTWFTDDNALRFLKGKKYQFFEPTEFEFSTGICFWVDSESSEQIPLTQKYFEKYFYTIEEMRQNKLNEILK